ncbi:MAG: hypothetical protein ABI718_05710 [Acidobacteriota bacterium]
MNDRNCGRSCWKRNSSSIRRCRDAGQAQTEYILLIGLVIIFILVMLINFRDSLNGFTQRVTDWINGQTSPASAPPPPAAPPPKVKPTPPPTPPPKATPTPTPNPNMSDDDWADWLVGVWCFSGNTWTVTRIGPGLVSAYQTSNAGVRQPAQTVRITSQGNSGFQETLPGSPGWFVNDQRTSGTGTTRSPSDTWQINSNTNGQVTNATARRCG